MWLRVEKMGIEGWGKRRRFSLGTIGNPPKQSGTRYSN